MQNEGGSTAQSVEQKIDAAKDSLGGRVKEKVGEVAENVKVRATQLKDKLSETEWSDVMQGVNGYVRDNPGKSIGIALGVGFALGLLLRRRDD
jgi:ElaB/YqjD/DUF883 family membrane-anchored ribosome-binding protein